MSLGSQRLLFDDKSMICASSRELTFEQRVLKRLMDIIVSAIGLVIASPIMLVTALAIKLEDHGPVFYRQKRATYAGRIFEVYKFRSMRVEDGSIHRSVTKDDDRITRVGHVIRKFRIDELPQLINVLKSDMSIVGPRPEMIENVDKYTQELPEFTLPPARKGGADRPCADLRPVQHFAEGQAHHEPDLYSGIQPVAGRQAHPAPCWFC